MSAPADNRPATARRGRRPASSTAASSTSSASSAPADNVVTLPGGQGAELPGELPVPGSACYRYTPGVGVWKDRRRVLPWCPIVTRHLVTYSPRGEILARRVTIAVGEVTATVSTRDVADGSVWANRFPGSAGSAGRDMRETLTNIVDDQAARVALAPVQPLWSDGRLILPPADVLPAGYAETAGTPDDFRAIVRALAEAPRVALAVGLAVGGLYVAPLGRQSYVVHLSGRSSAGKTTTANAAAAVFGNPRTVVKRWDVTGNGLGAWLRDMACLTGFRDELGAAKFRTSDLESIVFRATEGAQRDVSDRDGRLRETQGSWHGALFSTGNESIVERVPNEGVAARVVEFGGAMTPSAAWADRLDGLTRAGYGHGLPAIIDRALSPAEFAEWAERAGVAVELPEGGPGRRVGQHIALGVAGARLLGELFDVPELAEVAEAAGRELLAELAAGLVERGSDPGARLLAAIGDAMAARPAEFPTRAAYDQMAAGTVPTVREITGWDLTGDSIGGDVAIIQNRLSAITEPAGIEDPGIALRELRKRGLLLAPADGRNLARLVKVAGKPRRVYVLGGVFPDEAESAPGNDTPDGPVTTSVTTSVTASDQGGNDSNDISGDTTITCAREAEPAQGALDLAPVTEGRLTEPAPCAGCGLDAAWHYGGEPWHPLCRERAEDAARLAEVAERAAQTAVAASADVTPADDTPAAPIEAQTAVQPATRAAEPTGESTLARWLLDQYPDATRAELAEAERLWLDTMRGVPFRGPFVTAMRVLNGALKHQSIPELPALDRATVAEVLDGMRWAARTWVVPGEPLPLGWHLRAYDVNAMYPSAADIELGTGNPVRYVELPAGGLKLPGWVHMADRGSGGPYGVAERMPAGMWVPTPLAGYLTERGATLPIDGALLWPEHRRWLRPHVAMVRDARNRLKATEGRPAEMALRAVKATYTRLFGGALRSDRYNATDTLRLDWADMIVSTGQARMFRALDRVADARVIGVHVDAAWLLSETAEAHPAGLVVSDQLGKFKAAGSATVTAEVAEAYRVGMWRPIHSALEDQ